MSPGLIYDIVLLIPKNVSSASAASTKCLVFICVCGTVHVWTGQSLWQIRSETAPQATPRPSSWVSQVIGTPISPPTCCFFKEPLEWVGFFPWWCATPILPCDLQQQIFASSQTELRIWFMSPVSVFLKASPNLQAPLVLLYRLQLFSWSPLLSFSISIIISWLQSTILPLACAAHYCSLEMSTIVSILITGSNQPSEQVCLPPPH